MQFNLLKTKKHFLQDYNCYDTRNFYFSIDLIFWKIAFNINKNDPLDQII